MVGMGFVGGTTTKVLKKYHEIYPYDKYKEKYKSKKHIESLAENSEVIFICVDTPMKPSGEMDYSSIHNSAQTLTGAINYRNEKPLIVIRSTAVSGTTDKLEEKYPFNFAFNPEFLREKHALEDMLNTNKVVIGANRDEDYKKVEGVYKPVFPDAKYIHVNLKTSEMIKYANNVMLAGQATLANEIYQICKAVGVDFNAVKDIMLLDERIARNIEVPGPDGDFGFGGKCFPKDLNALIYLARENMYRPHLLEEVWRSNDEKFRTNKDWLNIPGATSGNKNFEKN